jgi:vancomycin resistance protein YoaR
MSLAQALGPAHAEQRDWASPGGSESVRLSSATTPLGPDEANRNHNIAKAASLIDGITIGPGEEFSFNRAVGERGFDQGYLPARVIADGRSEAGVAGGICQLSSTVYHAALLAGMSITERHPHSRPVQYTAPGLDATVAWGTLDLRWVNTRDGPVVIRCSLKGPRLVVVFEGRPPSPEIEVSAEVVEIIPPRPMAPPDAAGRSTRPPSPDARRLASPGAPGYRVEVWRTYTEADGSRVRELISRDLYEPINAVVQ